MRAEIIMLMACTLDGKIARNRNHYPDWTGSADKRMFRALSMNAGVIIMGSRTFDNIGRQLPGRHHVVITRFPERRSSKAGIWFTADSPRHIADELYNQGYKKAILAGGAEINTLFAQAGLIDEVVITLTPRIFGTGLGLFTKELDMELSLEDLHQIDTHTVFLRYRVVKRHAAGPVGES